jgi:hypothetical protein
MLSSKRSVAFYLTFATCGEPGWSKTFPGFISNSSEYNKFVHRSVEKIGVSLH